MRRESTERTSVEEDDKVRHSTTWLVVSGYRARDGWNIRRPFIGRELVERYERALVGLIQAVATAGSRPASHSSNSLT